MWSFNSALLSRLLLSLMTLCLLSNTATATSEVDTYEYVVIGSGPGGGPLAANLARNGHTVLLIEAGEDQGANVNETIPAFSLLSSQDEKMRWDFFVNHYTDNGQALRDPKMAWKLINGSWFIGLDPPAGAEQLGIYYPRSGTLGGCSTHNALAAVLPSDGDWDFIAELTGDNSWSGESMRKYFERVEKCNYLPVGTPGHGFNGFLQTNKGNPNDIIGQNNVVLDSARDVLGERDDLLTILSRDINTLDSQRNYHDAMWPITDHIDSTGARSSSTTYINATVTAKNADGSQKFPLSIRTKCLATRVLFGPPENGKPKAIGVEFLDGESLYSADPRYDSAEKGKKGQVYASKEVIVSGGVFNSPQILKLSGIGPKSELEKFGIPLIIDLPGVGFNLQDNYETTVISNGSVVFTGAPNNCTFGVGDDPCVTEFLEGFGPYRKVGLQESVFFKSSQAQSDEVDIFLWPLPGYTFAGYVPPGTMPLSFVPTAFGWSMVKIHPRSRRGSVTLKSADPRDVPEINFNYFEDGGDDDLQAMAEAVEWARNVFDGAKTAGPFTELQPCKDNSDCSLDTTKQFIKDQAYSHHAVGSCPIGANNDPMAVLDSKFKVRGVTGLRVVDGSIFPRVPGSFPILPTFIISEKATDAILEDANV